MKKGIFREKSIDRVKSPESLDDYIRVSNPSIWLLLISVIVLLAGACVWGSFGHVNSTVPAAVVIKGETTVCYVNEADMSSLQTGLTVKFADTEATITNLGEVDDNGCCCSLQLEKSIPDGLYEGKVITKSYKPLSFILN